MAEKVRVYDLKTNQLTEMPASELAPGMVLAEVPGVGMVFVAADQVGTSERKVNTQLPDGFEAVAKALWELLKKRLSSHAPAEEKWIDDFRRDSNPLPELLLWMRLSVAYHSMTHGGTDTDEIVHEVYAVLVSAMNNGDAALETVTLQRVSRARARTIVEQYEAVDAEALAVFWDARLEEGVLSKLLGSEGSA